MSDMPVIDYDAHPAFANWGGARASDAAAEALAADADEAYRSLTASSDLPPEERLNRYDREIAPKLNTLATHLSGRVRPQFKNFLNKALAVAHRVLREDLVARDSKTELRNDAENLRAPFKQGLALFRHDGCFVFNDTQLARLAWSMLPLERAMLRLRKRRIPGLHCVLAIHAYSPAGRIIRRAVTKSGLLDFVSSYIGKPMEFCYASLEHAHPAQNWYRDCYADAGLKTSKTVYMHTDADFDIIKTILYLKDVTDQDGPFRFVTGSHHWQRSPLTLAVQKGFDEASREVFAGSAETDNYYRPRFKLAENRQDLLSLPQRLRGSTHFGDDILDGSELSETLLKSERSFVAPAGTLVIFDGSRGIHRGGQVSPGGSRWVVQLAFRARQGATPTAAQTLRKNLRGTASYAKYLVTQLAALAAGRVAC